MAYHGHNWMARAVRNRTSGRGRTGMQEIRTKRLFLRPFMESDNDDLFEFLSQLKDDEFEGYPGINYENGRKISDRTSGSAGTKTTRLSGRIR